MDSSSYYSFNERTDKPLFKYSLQIASVRVTISGADGKVMEGGAALRNRLKRQMWTYETKVVSMESKGAEIKAMAEDHAENQTEAAVIIE